MIFKTPNFYIQELLLAGAEDTYRATLCCCFYEHSKDFEGLIQYLHSREADYYRRLQFEKRIHSYLIGRFVAKNAVSALTGKKDLADILIQPSIFSQPIVVTDTGNIRVSITHCDGCGAALAFPEFCPLGIDLEKVNFNKRDVLEKQMTEFEKEAVRKLPIAYDTGLMILWTAKEALSKVLMTGLTVPFEILEISKIEIHDLYYICFFKNFPQYKTRSLILDCHVCSLIYPVNTELYFDIYSFVENFASERIS